MRTVSTHKAIPALDGLRAIACVLVVFSHAVPGTNAGEAGVTLFFVLSGYLMGLLYLKRSLHLDSFLKYAVARSARILPLYWLIVTISLLAYAGLGWVHWPFPMTAWQWLLHVLCIGSIGPFWSISVEVQYYVWFVLIWWAAQVSFFLPDASVPARWGARGIWLLTILFVLLGGYAPGLALPNKLHLFLVGTLISQVPAFEIGAVLRRLLGSLLWLCLAVLVLWIGVANPAHYREVPIALLCGAILWLSATVSAGSAVRFLSTAVMQEIGRASFAIYITHMLFVDGVHALWPHEGVALAALQILIATAGGWACSTWIDLPMAAKIRSLMLRWVDRLFPRPGLSPSRGS